MEFDKARMRDVVAVAALNLRDCAGNGAPGPFMLADQSNAELWLRTIVELAKAADWDRILVGPETDQR